MTPWQKRVLNRINDIDFEEKSNYTNVFSLNHYTRVFNQLRSKYKDLSLERAGFLHGISCETIEDKLNDLVDKELLKILKGYESISALDPFDSDLLKHLKMNIIPTLNAKSMLLFIYENLDHLDPTREISEWTNSFSDCVNKFPDLKPTVHSPSSVLNDNNVSFLCQVITIMAESIGLWVERNVFDNISLWFENPDRFHGLIDFAIEMGGDEGLLKEIIHIVADALSNIKNKSIRWTWHHIASINRKLSEKLTKNNWQTNLYRCGYATVITNNTEICYKAIHLLHRKFGCRPNQLRDMLWKPTANGYQAIHTLVHSPISIREKLEAIPIRIIPEESVLRMDEKTKNPAIILKNFQGKAQRKRETIVTFTPDGKQIILQNGATVLNFALKLCERFIAYLRSANVNGNFVDLLHPLSDGDVIFLDIAEQPRLLPIGWEQKVPKFSIIQIKRNFRRFYKPALVNTGRNFVIEQLVARGIREKIPKSDLDSWVEQTMQQMHKSDSTPNTPTAKSHDWLYLKFGIMVSHKRGYNIYYKKTSYESMAKPFLKNLFFLIQSSKKYELDYNGALSNFDNRFIKYCQKCEPPRESQLIATQKGGIIFLHRIDASCAKGGFEVSRPYIESQAQYFVFETNNRIGIVANILTVFYKYEIDLEEIMAKRYGYSRAVIRIQVKNIDKSRIDAISDEVYKIDGVTQVFDPDQPSQPKLEADLPPRKVSNYLKPQSAPYVAGPPLENDEYFYGMQYELDELHESFKKSCRKGANHGLSVFVHGPKRIGKSSLVKCFLRRIHYWTYPRCLTFYIEAQRGDPWSETSKEIKRNLINSAYAIAKANGKNLPPLSEYDIRDILGLIQKNLNVQLVFAIDEIIGLLEESFRAGEEKEIFRFCEDILVGKNRLILWVGPEAPLRLLPDHLHQIFERSEPLRVQPLGVEDTKKLLEATKLSPYYKIVLHDKLSSRIWDLTQGNPYHISVLAKFMWRNAYKPGNSDTIYNDRFLNEAIDEILSYEIPFFGFIQIRDILDELILKLFSQIPEKSNGLFLKKIVEKLKKFRDNVNENEILERIEYLMAVGTLASRSGKKHQWDVSSPLLKRYFKDKYRPILEDIPK